MVCVISYNYRSQPIIHSYLYSKCKYCFQHQSIISYSYNIIVSQLPLQQYMSPLTPFQFVEPTGKRFLLAIDVSGSMTSYNVLGASSVSARVASAAMAMVTARTEANYHMVGFSNTLVPLNIHAKMNLAEVIKAIEKVSAYVLYTAE